MTLARRPRLALSGSAGTGKTTLGQALAARLGVPYVPEGMRARLEAGLALCSLGRPALRELFHELFAEQRAREAAALATAGGFIADRSSIDFIAHWLLYGLIHPDDGVTAFCDAARTHARTYDRIIVLPFGALELAADGIRDPNPWRQYRFQGLVEGLLRREVPPASVAWLPSGTLGLEARVTWVMTETKV